MVTFCKTQQTGLKEYYAIMQMVLNDQQRMIVDATLQDCKIIGNPGVGKTTIMIHKVCRHFQTGELPSKTSFLIVTFTRNACREFIARSKVHTHLFSDRNVMTIHKLASKIYAHLDPSRRVCDVNTLIHATLSLMRAAAQPVQDEIRAILPDLRLMIVDEAQDISGIQYEFICEIKKIMNNVLILIGDPNQNIFQFQGGSDQYLLNYPGKQFFLTINNRSTPSIVEFANYFRPNPLIPSMTASRRPTSGAPVEIFRISQDDIPGALLRLVDTMTVDPSEVAIIGPVKRSRKSFYSYMNIGLSLCENLLMNEQIPFIQHYPTVGSQVSANRRTPGKLNLHTIHSSKGDEFDTVILLNFHFFTQGRRPTMKDYNEYGYLWWTAITRAKNRLIIIMDRDKDHWPLLQTVPDTLYRLMGAPIQPKEFEVEIQSQKRMASIESLLDGFSESQSYRLQTLLQHDVEEVAISQRSAPHIAVDQHLGLIQGHLRLFYFYLAHHKQGDLEPFFADLRARFDCRLYIPKKYKFTLAHFLSFLGRRFQDTITFRDMYKYKDNWENDMGREFFYRLVSQMKDCEQEYSILLENDVIFQQASVVMDLIRMTQRTSDITLVFRNLFYINIYNFQMVHEKKYMWFHRETILHSLPGYEDLIPVVQDIVERTIHSDSHLRYATQHPNLGLRGCVDVFTPHSGDLHMIVFEDAPRNAAELILNHQNVFPQQAHAQTCVHIWDIQASRVKHIRLPSIRPFQRELLTFLCNECNLRMKDMKILYSTIVDKQNKIVDWHFEELALGMCISTQQGDTDDASHMQQQLDPVIPVCDNPAFITYGSNNVPFGREINLQKVLQAQDPRIRWKRVQRAYHHIFPAEKPTNRVWTARDTVRRMREMILHFELPSRKLI